MKQLALVIIGADFSKQRTYFQEVFHKVKKAKHPVSTGCFYMGQLTKGYYKEMEVRYSLRCIINSTTKPLVQV